MVQKIMKFVFGTLAFVGFLIILGTAGADCDGKCMERAMSLGDIMKWIAIGLTTLGVGVVGLFACND